MAIRWGTGPVFVYESITAARRWQGYALRSLFVLSMLVALGIVWQTSNVPSSPYAGVYARRELAKLGERIRATHPQLRQHDLLCQRSRRKIRQSKCRWPR